MRRSSVSNAMSSMTLTQAASTVSRSICASLAPVLHIAPNRVLKKSWVLMADLTRLAGRGGGRRGGDR